MKLSDTALRLIFIDVSALPTNGMGEMYEVFFQQSYLSHSLHAIDRMWTIDYCHAIAISITKYNTNDRSPPKRDDNGYD